MPSDIYLILRAPDRARLEGFDNESREALAMELQSSFPPRGLRFTGSQVLSLPLVVGMVSCAFR